MRVLILHSRYLSGAVSGENQVVEQERRLLADAGHDVHVWSPSPLESRGLTIVRTALDSVWSSEARGQIRSLVRRHRPDILHFHNIFPMLSPAALTAVGSEPAATVMTLHNFRLLCLPATFLRAGRPCESCLGKLPWKGVLHRCYRGSAPASAAIATSLGLHRGLGSFRRVQLYFAVSRFVRDKYVAAGFPADRLIVKPNFAQSEVRRVGPGHYFLYLGRLSTEKGVQTLVELWRNVPARLLIVGDGPERASLAAAAPPSVEFLAPVSPPEVPRLIAEARALLIPSIWYEGSPRVILEAYAAGVPVIASRIGGLPEIVRDGESGLLANPGDRDSWTRMIERVLDDTASVRLGAGARRLWDERYTPDCARRALEHAYSYALALRRGLPGDSLLEMELRV